MSRPNTGTYVIHPKDDPSDNLTTGVVGVPVDKPVRVGLGGKSQFWDLIDSEDNTFNVVAKTRYKWIVTENNDLFASVNSPPGNFRFESAGNDNWVIALPGQDLVLTLDRDASPALTFKPADGSDAQRFLLTQVN